MYVIPSKHNGLLAPLYMLFIVAVALQQKSLLNIRSLVYLGDISYGIYILQMPVYFIVSEFNKSILHIGNVFFFLLYVIVLIVVSALCYTFIEKPLRKKINALKL
jgi:peptidoglycan/LPS O-acetylase OafA/YrhL